MAAGCWGRWRANSTGEARYGLETSARRRPGPAAAFERVTCCLTDPPRRSRPYRRTDRNRGNGTGIRGQGGHPRGAGARTLRYVPDRHRQADEGHGSVRTDHRPRVRGYRRIIAHLRAVRRRAGPWMDERVRRHQHAFHRGSHDSPHGTPNRRRSTCHVWRPGNSPAHFPCRNRPWVPMLLPYRPRRSVRTAIT